jgi:hypothetical protein
VEVVVSTCNATLHSKCAQKLSYFTLKLQSNTHLTHYSYELNLDRALGEQLIRIGYLLKITTEMIGTTKVLADRYALVVPNRDMSTVLAYGSRVVYFGLGSRLIGALVS